MRVVSAESTELFVGPSDAPLQLVRVAVTGCTEPAPIRIHGDGLAGEAAARPGDDVIEVAVAVESPVVGERRTRGYTPPMVRAWRSSSPWPSPAGRCS